MSIKSKTELQIETELNKRLGTHIKNSWTAVMNAKNASLKAYRLSVAQYAILFSLSQGELTAAQLARSCAITPQSVTSLLHGLMHKKLITKKRSEIHSNMYLIALTPAGREIFEKANRVAKSIENSLSQGFTPEEEKTLRILLKKSEEILSQLPIQYGEISNPSGE